MPFDQAGPRLGQGGILLAVLMLSTVVFDQAIADSPLKNVVLIVADDLGLQLGCYGDSVVQTPHLDRLADSGVRFTRAYCTTSSCSASRSAWP